MRRWRNAGGDIRGTRVLWPKLLTHSTSIRSATKFIVRSMRSGSSAGISVFMLATCVAAR